MKKSLANPGKIIPISTTVPICPSPSSWSPHFQSGPRTTRRPTSRRITDAELLVEEEEDAAAVVGAPDPGDTGGPGKGAGGGDSADGDVDAEDGMIDASGLRRLMEEEEEEKEEEEEVGGR